MIEFYEESLKRQANESAQLANKLAEIKNAILDDNIVVQIFKGENLGIFFNSKIEVNNLLKKITFCRTDDNIYSLILNENNKLEYISVEDIDYFRQNEKYETGVDLCYFVIRY